MTQRKKHIITFAAATLLLFTAMNVLTDFPLLDTMWRPSTDEIHRAVAELNDSQIRAYRIMLAVDFLYALAYTGLLVLLFRYYGSNQRFRSALHRTGIAAALSAGVLDYLENGLILAILAARPEESPVAVVLAAVTTLKWIAVGAAVLFFVAVMFISKGSGPRRK
jgi:hypothetical protein